MPGLGLCSFKAAARTTGAVPIGQEQVPGCLKLPATETVGWMGFRVCKN